MLFDRSVVGEVIDLCLLLSGAWLRAVVDGTVYVLAFDFVLICKLIMVWIGGCELFMMLF